MPFGAGDKKVKYETAYQGFKIEFDSFNRKYIASDKDGDVIKESKTEEEVIKYLNDFLKGKKKINIPFIRGIKVNKDGNYFISLGKITSIAQYKDGKVYEVWISVSGDRMKEYIDRIYSDTPENREKMNEIIEIRRKINTLSEEKEKIEKTLTHPEIQIDEEVAK